MTDLRDRIVASILASQPQIVTGPTGATGPQGDTGTDGSHGKAGLMGRDGLPGPAGERGVNGEPGAAGPTGATGPEGPTGPKGDKGATGPAGPAGRDGGRAGGGGGGGGSSGGGATGATGPAGATGATGATGTVAAAVTDQINQAAHGLAVGDVVRLSGTSYIKAQADSVTNAEVVGIVSAVAGVNDFTLTTHGLVSGLSGLTAGTVSFLSDGTAGLLTATEPTTLGSVSKPVLVADTTTSGYLNNFRGTVVVAAASGPILTATRTLTSAEILALFTTPITLVAGVANKVVVPILIMARSRPGTVAYANAANLFRISNGATTQLNLSTVTNMVGGAVSRVATSVPGSVVSTDTLTALSGAALTVTVQIANPTTGNGTLDLTVLYYLLDVT